MKVGWLQDRPPYQGGAELTADEFRAAAPEGVEVIDCQPGEVDPSLDRYVVHTCVYYSPEDVEPLRGKPIIWFHHDLSPWNKPEVQGFLNDHADHIFCSPAHRDKYGLHGPCIPPPLDLSRFKAPRQSEKRRKGYVSLAQWRGAGKGTHLLEEWAEKNGPIDVWGSGEFPPIGDNINLRGPVEPEYVPQLLWNYETFVFLPLEFEPFCRTVAEAHAAGCKIITNRQIGATYWLTENPEGIEAAAEDFWGAVCG